MLFFHRVQSLRRPVRWWLSTQLGGDRIAIACQCVNLYTYSLREDKLQKQQQRLLKGWSTPSVNGRIYIAHFKSLILAGIKCRGDCQPIFEYNLRAWKQVLDKNFERCDRRLLESSKSVAPGQWFQMHNIYSGVKDRNVLVLNAESFCKHECRRFDGSMRGLIDDMFGAENEITKKHGTKYETQKSKEVIINKERKTYRKQQARRLLPSVSATSATQVSKRSRRLLSSHLPARHFTASRSLSKSLEDTELQNRYVYDNSSALTDDILLRKLRKETALTWPKTNQLIDEMQGKFLSFLVQTTQAQHVLEIGCFTGYSALCLANGLKSNGSLVTCDIDADTMQFAQRFFNQSSHAKQIVAVNQDGLNYLNSLPQGQQFDFIFIDANKRKYRNYYDSILEHNLLHPLGLLVFDNTLFRGRVASSAAGILNTKERIARSLAKFNAYVDQDSRSSQVVLPLWDGLTLVRRAR